MPSKTTKRNTVKSKTTRNSNNKPIKTLYEKIDKDLILRILASSELTDEEKNALHKYKQKISNRYVPVNYFFSKGSNFGRLYAEGSLSLQNFRKGIRHALAEHTYDDIDMVNAHPVLLSQYCVKNNIRCDLLSDYVNNREVWLSEIMDFHNVGRDCAKKLVLKLCYLGNYEVEEEEDENINRCCICHNIQRTYKICDGNVCRTCSDKGKKCLCNSERSVPICLLAKNWGVADLELNLIDLYHEIWNLEVDVNSTLESLNSTIDDIYPPNPNGKLKKLEKFAAELKMIANLVYKIEKDISDVVDEDDSKHNKKSSVLSMTAQILEHDCLMSMSNFFESKGFKVGVYCFDGLMIEKDNKKIIADDLLEKCSNYVKKETGYKIKLEIKPMNQSIAIPQLSEYVDNDKDVQEKLFILENSNYFRFCGGELYVFNELTGRYESNIEALNHYIIKHGYYFKKEIIISDKRSDIKFYGRDASLMAKIPPFIKEASRADEWLEETANTSLGYLLFKDGIYNMKTGIFTKGFDPSIVFHERVPHNFPERNEDEVKYAANMSFNLMLENPMPLMVAFARALAGDITAKKFIFIPGKTNSGKSKLVNMFINSFGGYVKNFNAENMAYTDKTDTRDEASKNRWAYLIRFARIIFSNEVNMKKVLNGNDIKKMASGGDKVVGRTHFKEETQFVPHFTPFCMLNDIPSIEPMDDAVYGRLVYCEFKKQFVDEVTEEYHIKADPDLDEKIRDPKFIRGFIHLILGSFIYFLENGQPEFDAVTKEEWTEGDRKDKNIIELLKNNFEITNINKDFITVSDMNKFRNKNIKDSIISNKRFNEIVYEAFKIRQAKRNGVRGWIGIIQKKLGI
jgi:hypothetical protein